MTNYAVAAAAQQEEAQQNGAQFPSRSSPRSIIIGNMQERADVRHCPELHADIYRNICIYLPPPFALELLLVSRSIYRACDDWTVWREVIRRSRSFECEVPNEDALHQDAWKQYVVADAKAWGGQLSGARDMEWFPHMIALHHPGTSSMNATALLQICDPIIDGMAVTDQKPHEFGSNVQSSHDVSTWRLAQAAAFCITAQLLSEPLLDNAVSLLECVPWFRSNGFAPRNTAGEVHATNTESTVIMQHTLANRAIGLFCIQLSYALANRGTSSGSTKRLFSPPTLAKLPLQNLMQIPPPLFQDDLNIFSHCHLRSMTDPIFFTDDTWTGCFSSGRYGSKTTFNAIGGRNVDLSYQGDIGRWGRMGQFPHGRDFEHVVRFRLAEPNEKEGDEYKLESNNFYSEGEIHHLHIDVQKSTGRLRIAHWHRLMPEFMVTEAVVTPFGIISGLFPKSSWLYLWKTGWSEVVEIS